MNTSSIGSQLGENQILIDLESSVVVNESDLNKIFNPNFFIRFFYQIYLLFTKKTWITEKKITEAVTKAETSLRSQDIFMKTFPQLSSNQLKKDILFNKWCAIETGSDPVTNANLDSEKITKITNDFSMNIDKIQSDFYLELCFYSTKQAGDKTLTILIEKSTLEHIQLIDKQAHRLEDSPMNKYKIESLIKKFFNKKNKA